ncbi:MAG: hypothetical protein EPO65_01580 [Dehalococcoidia bacterium]|nr:MAG: hypothetical protein EPO65_01580 [Dehalococcoidia bacterium]
MNPSRLWQSVWHPRLGHANAPVGADRPGNASQDAGWARLHSADGAYEYGRGHLKVWEERVGSEFPSGRFGQLESFVPGSREPEVGQHAELRPETEPGVYSVTVREYDRSEGRGVVTLRWLDSDDLPALLLETGGNGYGQPSSNTGS